MSGGAGGSVQRCVGRVGKSVAEVMPPYSGEAPRPSDRTPPQDMEAEQCVPGAMLMSKDAIADVVEVLRGADFYRPAHEQVYNAIIDLYGRGEPAIAITVSDARAWRRTAPNRRRTVPPYAAGERPSGCQWRLLRADRARKGGPAPTRRSLDPDWADVVRRRGRRR